MTNDMRGGWFAVKRGMLSHPIFHKRPDRAYVWLWMLETAAYQDTRQDAGGRPVDVKRGQILTSFRQIEAATGVSLKTIRGLIDLLKSERAIGIDLGTGRMLITICNYEKYQTHQSDKGADSGTARARQGHTKETREQINNTPKPPEGAGEFDEFWSEYPHRGGQKKNRKGAISKYHAAIKRGASHEEIMAGVRAMRRFPDVARGFARDPSVWLMLVEGGGNAGR